MGLTIENISLIAGCAAFLLVLSCLFHFYKFRLLSISLKFCNWICGMAIGSDSPWVKMCVLHIVFIIRLLMYLSIVSLEQVDKLSTKGLLREYVSGTKLVFRECLLAFKSPEEAEKRLKALETLSASGPGKYRPRK
ncbi:MAG: hypothetical protein PHW56_04215 [Methanosarcinaceae archaeon]|nr:hypothetical protein [Methanosarcinaceae archaeon]